MYGVAGPIANRSSALVLPAMNEAEAYSPPGMPLPNVAHDRAHGVTSIRVYCEGLYCPHWRVFTFDELAVPDELPVIHIPRVRRFVCSRNHGERFEAKWSLASSAYQLGGNLLPTTNSMLLGVFT
jgi:hypothetical protein